MGECSVGGEGDEREMDGWEEKLIDGLPTKFYCLNKRGCVSEMDLEARRQTPLPAARSHERRRADMRDTPQRDYLSQ